MRSRDRCGVPFAKLVTSDPLDHQELQHLRLGGMVRMGGGEVSTAQSDAVLTALRHRGPDAEHVWTDGPCTLLHTRLRVIDVAARADQPMTRGSPARVLMIFNGEIYNYRELRRELSEAGEAFSTTSDAEVFLAGYATWGVDVFRRARGMWAAAFWHPESRKLVLSRDPLGKKPLVYSLLPDGISFASSVGALLPLLPHQPEVDRTAIDCYLGHLVVPFEHSVFVGVCKLPPGGVATWTERGGLQSEIFWTPPSPQESFGGDPVPEVERLLRQAVRRRLESDVPLGVFLSAGFDSGLVAALAAEESGQRLVAVTAGTVGSGYDERSAAAIIAQRYDLDHRVLEVPALSAGSLPMLMSELGEPFGDASILPSYEVSRAARREITVALTGDGGDEGFFGYATFRAVRLAARYRAAVPASLRRALHGVTHGITTGSGRRLAAFLEYGAEPLVHSFRNRMGFSSEERQQLQRSPGSTPHTAEHIYADRLARWKELADADALRRMFVETFLPNDYLTKVDTATMAASLEARCPFLDRDVMEFRC